MYKKILLPTDGSKYSENAEQHALFLAEKSGAEIIALSVIENGFSIGLPSDDTIYEINQMLKEETKQNLKRVEEIRDEVDSSIKVTSLVKEGSPAAVILDVAEDEDVDLIVIGSSGKTGFDRFLMGSVASKVVKSAKCSVLVVN
ncbi:MAG: universal stress protein [Methanobrevibacter boviskoreani]|uniref:universal stress protein n=1 Tax=Methanobrevibacter TaxID=2172 RepID=UPI0003348230|nr:MULTISPECIES: universal stress protein [Methanobrevibacter]AGN16300.1 universal stress protein UspA1 [Methanobrevibacter sp. AbM4]MCI6775106.1 universal stress protein [Methanobrevibacter boviskoreani]MCI6930782.1 universal stress protein [Methanobrevibacter boviskoreani]MDY5614506.1 universal stress protein [Methanobrevibacter boviskoreani]